MDLKRKLSLTGVFAGMAFFVSGCVTGWNVDTMKETTPTGNAFTQALYAEYSKLVDGEVQQEDWKAADFFAIKGTSAANGVEVMPEEPGDWGVPAGDMDQLVDMRAMLVELLDVRGRNDRPEVAAKAQVSYDCMVEQYADREHHQPYHMKMCREAFLASIAALKAPLQQTYAVFFRSGSSALSKESRAVLKEVAAAAEQYPDWFLRVEGHTDTVASMEYNRKLSLRRSAAVREYLKRLGVEGKRVYTSGHSEKRLAVETKDNVHEKQNRRVVITFTETR